MFKGLNHKSSTKLPQTQTGKPSLLFNSVLEAKLTQMRKPSVCCFKLQLNIPPESGEQNTHKLLAPRGMTSFSVMHKISRGRGPFSTNQMKRKNEL